MLYYILRGKDRRHLLNDLEANIEPVMTFTDKVD